MSSGLVLAVLTGFGGMIGWGLADFFAKKTIDRIGDVQSLAWAGIFGTITFGIATAYQTVVRDVAFAVPQEASTWIYLAVFGALQAAVYLFAYKGFGKGQIALLNPVFASFSGIVALVSIFALGEVLSGPRLAAIMIVFAGVFALSLDLSAFGAKKFTFTRIPGFNDVAIAACLAAVWTILWSLFVEGQDALAYAFYMFIFMTITVFLWAFIKKLPMRVTEKGIWIFLALIGISETLAYTAITLGYGATEYTSVVAVLSGGFSLPTIILAHIYLGERISKLQWVGCVAIIAGVMILPLV